jgi:release factor glutamine methyltransferase
LNIATARLSLVEALTPMYGASEATQITKILFDDFFNIHAERDDAIFEQLLETDFWSIKTRLLNAEPIQYIVGFSYFYGLKLKVNPNVLIPRPETEELVFWLLETFKKETVPKKILDIGTGSGCIALSLKNKRADWQVYAVDVSEGALITASRNAYRNVLDVHFERLDILDNQNWNAQPMFDVIVSNPPYIPQTEKALMHANVLDFEPALALFVENDNPLIFYERIAHFAQTHLTENGMLFLECNEHNATDVVTMLKNKHFKNIELQRDMSQKDRMIRAML